MGKQLLKSWFALVGMLFLLQSCGTFMQQPVQSEPARIGEATQTAINLKNLPLPPHLSINYQNLPYFKFWD